MSATSKIAPRMLKVFAEAARTGALVVDTFRDPSEGILARLDASEIPYVASRWGAEVRIIAAMPFTLELDGYAILPGDVTAITARATALLLDGEPAEVLIAHRPDRAAMRVQLTGCGEPVEGRRWSA